MDFNVELLEKSFHLVAPRGKALVARFYERLFEKYPETKRLFQHANMRQQRKKLLASLVLVVQNLRKPDVLKKALHQLGGQHQAYGVKPAHYAAVKENLLAVLGEFAGSAWTSEVKQAWAGALEAVSTTMLEGGKQQQTIGHSTGGVRSYGPNKQSRHHQGGEGIMNSITKVFSNWGITGKLTAMFCVFGLIPVLSLGWVSWQTGQAMEASVGKKFQVTASGVADTIDRNLAERYGEVQSFAMNRAAQEVFEKGNRSAKNNLVQAMNGYMASSGSSYLSIMVDVQGNVIAVNDKADDGRAIDTQYLYGKNFSQTPWFRALQTGKFTTAMPFSAPENTKSTGTYIEDLHVDEDVKKVYSGDDGLTLGFSAPVYGQNGKVLGYWTNRVKFSLVEEIFASTYQDLKADGYPGAELTLLDSVGRIIVDYDPVKHGKEEVVHDLDNVLMKVNLAEKGVATAQQAVAGKTGYMNALHARKKIVQAGGYTHLQGALGYPGMNWSVLVRIPQVEAAAAKGCHDAKGVAHSPSHDRLDSPNRLVCWPIRSRQSEDDPGCGSENGGRRL